MKKNILYASLLVVFIVAAGFVVIKYQGNEKKKQSTIYALLGRKGTATETEEWKNNKKNSDQLLMAIKKNPGDKKSMLALATVYLLEARATGNYQYYDKAAMKYLNEVISIEYNNVEALSLKSMIYLSQHHFAEGLALAQFTVKINPYNAFLYGVLVDGHVEMGNYDSAVLAAEKMMSIRPDLRSYARASYLREIHGDYTGAIEAMQLAVEAGLPGDEATEWARVQLGHLFENTGNIRYAEMNYAISLQARPGYVHALAGLARVALFEKKYEKAIAYYLQADSLVNDFTYKEELIGSYQLAGQKEKAAAIAKLVIDDMANNAERALSDESIGHYADKELAFAYLKTGNTNKALEHALAEYNRRPKNIDANETVAWVYHVKGEDAKAVPYMDIALKTNSKNPVLLCRAGLIYEKAGNKAKAKECLEQALKNNANIPELLKLSSEQALKEI